jgi:hypothetical protein
MTLFLEILYLSIVFYLITQTYKTVKEIRKAQEEFFQATIETKKLF